MSNSEVLMSLQKQLESARADSEAILAKRADPTSTLDAPRPTTSSTTASRSASAVAKATSSVADNDISSDLSSPTTAANSTIPTNSSGCFDCSSVPLPVCPPCGNNQQCVYTTRTCDSCSTAVCVDNDAGGPSTGTIVGAAVGSAVGLGIILALLFLYWRRRKRSEAGGHVQVKESHSFASNAFADPTHVSQRTDSFFNEHAAAEKDAHFLSFGSQMAGGRGSVLSALDPMRASTTIDRAQVIKPIQASVTQVKPKVVNVEMVRSESQGNSPPATIHSVRDSVNSIESAEPSVYFGSGVPLELVREVNGSGAGGATAASVASEKHATHIYEFKRVNTLGRSRSRRGKVTAGDGSVETSQADGASSTSASVPHSPGKTGSSVAPEASIIAGGSNGGAPPVLSVPPASYNRMSRRLMPEDAPLAHGNDAGSTRSVSITTAAPAIMPAAVTSPPSPTISKGGSDMTFATAASALPVDGTASVRSSNNPASDTFFTESFHSQPSFGPAMPMPSLPLSPPVAPITTATTSHGSLTAAAAAAASLVPSDGSGSFSALGPHSIHLSSSSQSLGAAISSGPSLTESMGDIFRDILPVSTLAASPTAAAASSQGDNRDSLSLRIEGNLSDARRANPTSANHPEASASSSPESTGSSLSSSSDPFSNAHAIRDKRS
ncbi:hypothetical protein IWQ60_009521 [Tieghemiomyces parasiticus]|uniref:Membrane anchor Opy2 N-terminal domain-containing protein n=1 Tax=Tieghemiomyces parasiticus TaxID=78921 RepID=A0A9W7ZTR0_9FUNG|nr:hypothetical protein IWQ60_009521 [Tieghemiomyces parasiticus]